MHLATRSGGVQRLPEAFGDVQLSDEKLGDGVHNLAVFADVEDPENVRVRERGHGLRLALKPGERLGIADDLLRKDLDRNVAVQPFVAGPPDLSHAPRAERSQDLIGTKPATGANHKSPVTIHKSHLIPWAR